MRTSIATEQVYTHRSMSDSRSISILVPVFPAGVDMGARYELGDKPMVLGRQDDCEITIHDASVSRHHVRIEPAGSRFKVTDMGSTNGSTVNDAPASGTYLNDGDFLRVGNCLLKFLSGENLEARFQEELYRLAMIHTMIGQREARIGTDADRVTAGPRLARTPASDLELFKTFHGPRDGVDGDRGLRAALGFDTGLKEGTDLEDEEDEDEPGESDGDLPAKAADVVDRFYRRRPNWPFAFSKQELKEAVAKVSAP